jgi:hypothetical protein
MVEAFAIRQGLRTASRFPSLVPAKRISFAELSCLIACGALAVIAIGVFQQLRLPMPGNAILRGALPMALGLALVPRRSAGIIESIGACLTAGTMTWLGIGRFPHAAVLSIVALGPVLDFTLAKSGRGWRLYARFIAAGAVANLLAYVLKAVAFQWGLATGSGGNFAAFGWMSLASFLFFGSAAGLVSALICFRMRAPDDLRRA